MLSEILKERRSELGLTQQEVAEELNVARQTVSSWETAKNYPDIPTLVKISDYYALSLDYMLKGDEGFMKKVEKDSKELAWLRKMKYIYAAIIILVPLLVLLQFTQSADGGTDLWKILYFIIRICIVGVILFSYYWMCKAKRPHVLLHIGYILLLAGLFIQTFIPNAGILSFSCTFIALFCVIFGAQRSRHK